MALKSMTGFSFIEFLAGGLRFYCMVRSVNRRGLEVEVRIPTGFQALEPQIRRLVAEYCQRGAVCVSIEPLEHDLGVAFDEQAAVEAFKRLKRIAELVGTTQEIPITALLSLPGVLRTKAEAEPAQQEVLDGLRQALVALDESRRREGEAIEQAVRSDIAEIRATWAEVEKEVRLSEEAMVSRARAKVKQLLAEICAEPTIIANALASLAERMAVSEEILRLKAHLDEFQKILESEPPNARKLDFLCQEMIREANTLAAKAQNAKVSHLVVAVKDATERIREHLANCV